MICVFFGMKLLGHKVGLCFTFFKKTAKHFSKAVVPFNISKQYIELDCSTSLPKVDIVRLKCYHYSVCTVISHSGLFFFILVFVHYGLNLHFC